MAAVRVQHIGERISALRRSRGWSQVYLATRLHKSTDWLAKIERGERSADRYSTLQQFAQAFGVPLSELIGAAPTALGAPQRDAAAVVAVRSALSDYSFLRASDAPPLQTESALGVRIQHGAALHAEDLDEAWALAHSCDYAGLADVLAHGLIALTEFAARRVSHEHHAVAWRQVAEVHQLCCILMAAVADSDCTLVSSQRAILAAELAGDRLLMAMGIVRMAEAMLAAGLIAEPTLAIQSSRALARGDSPSATQVRGAVALMEAICDARRGDAQSAARHIADAYDAATTQLSGSDPYRTALSPLQVAGTLISTMVELGDPAEAIRVADDTLDIDSLPLARRAVVLVDLARAYLERREAHMAIAQLEQVHQLAPQHLATHWQARALVNDLLRRRTIDRRLRALGRAAGLL